MNITHAVDENVVGDSLIAIFNRQKELMEKYHDIEKRSGLLQTEDCPVNLDDKRGQAIIKDFAWRIMEEVGEALDAKENDDWQHYVEELIDGLHFLTELTILAGVKPEEVLWENKVNEDMLEELCRQVIDSGYGNKSWESNKVETLVMDLGMMCNCLKNKPWKQTNMITDKENFKHKLKLVWLDYVAILTEQLNAIDIVNIYLKKSQVNKFRQRSGY